MSSRRPGFYKLPPQERLEEVKGAVGLDEEEAASIWGEGLSIEQADKMIENVIGRFEFPLAIATNFLIDDRDYLVPMAIEEPSVVAAASNAARMARVKGGFKTTSTGPVMIGQIQLTGVKDPYGARMEILKLKEEIVGLANRQDPTLVKLGGGCRDVEVRVLDSQAGAMVITHLLVDCRDAMGANAVNTMAEAVAPLIEEVTGGKVYLRIISNLASYRLARARAVFDKEAIGGKEVVKGIVNAYSFARADPFRCATHNKGIMNGISAVTLATGNDTRAVEAGAHAYASISGSYKPLTTYEENEEGDLVATIEVPMAVGLVGGATSTHPVARAAVKILGVGSAQELARVMAAVGLAQNFSALRALATEGIQRGHMSLHAKNIAAMAGAVGEEIDRVAEKLAREGKVRVDKAKEVLDEVRRGS